MRMPAALRSDDGLGVIAEVFLVCALTLPGVSFTRPWMAAKSERDQLVEWLRKNNPDAEVFINDRPQRDKLKQHGWERVPFTWKGQEIWIQRKPKSDQRPMKQQILASA